METPSVTPNPTSVDDAGYRFVLPTFQGPLDLLLHLIRINEVDITDLPVADIAIQYEEMVNLMEHLNLEVAGEFLVMAATLIYIKSKMLLPVEKERIELGLEEDPRKNLVQALLEHQRFQEAAEDLSAREGQAALVYTRQGASTEPSEQGYLEVSLFDLLNAFKGLLEVAGKRAALTRKGEQLPLSERIAQVRVLMESRQRVAFKELLPAEADMNILVVTFLAILELIKIGFMSAVQARPLAEIQLRRVTTA
jgi:segregation and condensation protein A